MVLTLSLLAVIWPLYPLLGNRIAPLVLGMPFSLVWNVIWLLVSCGALAIYHLLTGEHGEH